MYNLKFDPESKDRIWVSSPLIPANVEMFCSSAPLLIRPENDQTKYSVQITCTEK